MRIWRIKGIFLSKIGEVKRDTRMMEGWMKRIVEWMEEKELSLGSGSEEGLEDREMELREKRRMKRRKQRTRVKGQRMEERKKRQRWRETKGQSR